MTGPLTFAFEVHCPVGHAFATWTDRIGTWWPKDHTLGGDDCVDVTLQPWLGGRIAEREADGTERRWGEVTSWDPPRRLAYRWHLGRPAADATDVDIRFVAITENTTRIEIEHTGWDAPIHTAGRWRERNQAGWQTLIPHYRRALLEAEENA